MEKIHCVPKVLLLVKHLSSFCLNAAAESVDCSPFLKNLETHFCKVTCKKTSSTLKIYRNIYRKNLSAIIYRLSISL